MTKWFPSSLVRFFAHSVLILMVCLGLVCSGVAQGTGSPSGPKIWLQDSQPLPVTFTGAAAAPASGLLEGITAPQPVAMAQGDFDQDGITDLAVGYSAGGAGFIAIHRGNLDAFAPQSNASFQAIARGQFPAPFLPQAKTFSVPVSPDLIAAGNFTGHGHTDLVMASRGGTTLYIFAGDGKGNFTPGPTINLPGGVTSLASGGLGKTGPFTTLLVGVSGPQQNLLAVYGGGQQGLAPLAAFPLSAPVTNINFGNLGASGPDAVFLTGGQVAILYSSTMRLETLSLPVSASALALGSFVSDRVPGLQIALLDSSGSIFIAAHNEFDPRAYSLAELQTIRRASLNRQPNPYLTVHSTGSNGWKIVESFPSAAPFTPGQPPVLFRTRISNHGADDVMVLNAYMGQMSVVSHPDVQTGATTFLPGLVSARTYSGSPLAAISARVNVDGRPGVLALHQGEIAPRIMMPLPDPTFNVNTTADGVFPGACLAGTPNQCTLREAILEANGDTIMVPAGTYTLTLPKVGGDYSGTTGALYMNNSATIVGAVDGGGNPASIIQAGTTATNGVDLVMAVNQDIGTFTNATGSLSNLVITFGHNNGTIPVGDGFGGGIEFDTGLSGNNNLTLTNCTVTNNSTTDGDGGGLALFNTNAGTGLATITQSTIQNNSPVEAFTGNSGLGGGIYVGFAANVVLNNTNVINNTATQAIGVAGQGGGLFFFGGPISAIHGGSISGNTSAGLGGGIYSLSGLTIDTDTVISNNTAGGDGGGLWYNALGATATLSKVTITGNTAGTNHGGGIRVDSGGPTVALNMSFSRLVGNTATGGGSNLSNLSGTVTATDNWWGTNSPAGTIEALGGTTTFDPFIVLTHTASPDTVAFGGSTTLTADFLHDNHGTGILLSDIDVLLGLPITFNNPVLGTLSGQQATIQPSGTATALFTAGTTPGTGHADAVVDNGTATANITIAAFVIAKSFGATSIPLNGTTSLTFTITNSNGAPATGIAFTDNLPAGLVVATPGNLNNTCGGTATAVDGSSSVSLSGGTLAASASCTVSVNTQGTTPGVKNNSVQVTSTEGGTGNTSNATLTVASAPVIIKAFGAASIPLNGSTSLSFTIQNNNTTLPLTGIGFSDTLPAGLVVSTPNGQTGTCGGGAITATQGTNVISLSGGQLAASGSCTFSVNVTGTAAGQQNNTTGNVTSTEGGTGGTASASIPVVAPPTIAKVFNPATISLNGTTTLTLTLTNPAANTVAETGVAVSDTLPVGLQANPASGASNCGSPIFTTGAIMLTGGTIAVNSNCTITVTVTGTQSGLFTNTTGAVSSTNGGTGNVATANLTVASPPTITKAFGANTIPLNGTTSLTFNITNPNTGITLTGIAFTDNLPAGLVVATPGNLNNTCGGTATAVAGSGSVSLLGGTLAASASCTVSLNTQGTTPGVKNNTVQVISTEGGTGNTSNASITVVSPPTLSKAFGAASIPLNGTTTLSFTVSNPNATVALSGIAFSDTLPAGLVFLPSSLNVGTCGSPFAIIVTAGSVSVTGGALAAAGSCTFSINSVTGTVAGTQTNITGSITSTEGGTGAPANASIAVVAPPSIAKAFNPPGVAPNGISTLTITITNPPANTVAEAGVAVSDTLPAGLQATPISGASTCGGSAIFTTGAITLTGGTIAVNGTCTVTVAVTGTQVGLFTNTTGAVSSTNGGTGGSASATLFVAFPPTISKLFLPTSTVQNGTSLVSFTITNPNSSNGTPPPNDLTLTGISFTDTLPTGLVVASPNNLSNDCGGAVTADPGSTSISLSGGSLGPAAGLIARRPAASRFRPAQPPVANGQCFISVKVQATAAAPATLNNTTGPISANESGQGAASNTASLTVTPPPPPPTLAKAFGAPTISLNGTTTLTFAMANPNSAVAMTNISFTDILPSGLVVASPNGLPNGCADPSAGVTGSVIANPGSNAISMTALTLNPLAACSFSLNVTATSAGTKNNTTSNVTAAFDDGTGTFIPITGGPASASITVLVADLTIAKSHVGNFTQGDVGHTYQIMVSNVGTGTSSGTVTVTDSLPAFLIGTNISGTGWTCTLATLTCTRSDALNNGSSYPPITLTVSVAVNAPPSVTNSVTVAGGNEANTANDTATDPTTINQLPGPPLTIGLLVPATQTIKAGNSASFVFDVVSHSATLGQINFSCSGVPPGSTCGFTPQGESQGDAQVTMTLTTTANTASAMPFGLGRSGPVYAALLFPLLGLVSIAAAGRRGKKNRLRLLLFLGSLFVLLALAGCGGRANNGTPIGAFPITVTATSAANPTVTATTQLTVTVQ